MKKEGLVDELDFEHTFFLQFFIDICFTVLCQLLPFINMNQPQVYICPLPLEPPSHLPPIPSLQVVTEHQVELPVSYSKFPLAVCFTYGNEYVSMMFFSSSSHPLLPPLCPQVYCLSASSLLPCRQVYQHHLSRFHIYVLLYNICLSLSDLLHSLQQALASSTSLVLTQMC